MKFVNPNSINDLMFTDNSFAFKGVPKKTNHVHTFTKKHKCLNCIDNSISFTKQRVFHYIKQLEENIDVIGYTIENHKIPIEISGNNIYVQNDIEVFTKNKYSHSGFDGDVNTMFIFCMKDMKYRNFTMFTEEELNSMTQTQIMIYDNDLKAVSYELLFIDQINKWCKKQNATMFVDYGEGEMETILDSNLSILN